MFCYQYFMEHQPLLAFLALSLSLAVSLSGMTKQDYITNKLLDRTINVKASCKVHRAVYDRLTEVLEQLERINSGESIDDELMDNITLITRMVDGLYVTTN